VGWEGPGVGGPSIDTGAEAGIERGRLTAPTGWRRVLFRLPIGLYRARLGIVLGHRFVLVNHVGRRTGRAHQTVLEVVAYDRSTGEVTVASGFGPEADWYRNLLAHPDASIQQGTSTVPVHAVPLVEHEAADLLAGYARRHPVAARVLTRSMGLSATGSPANYRAVARTVPVIRFVPTDGA
jgi:deazaflavin-dependent oxidoreductase (nitroreductase family)